MHLSSIVRFRKQVEDMVREELALAEWEKSQKEAQRDVLRKEVHQIGLELERNLRAGVGKVFAEERFKWLEETGQALEALVGVLNECNKKTDDLRGKLQEAYHARRLVEIIMAKKEEESVRTLKRMEQGLQDEVAALKYFQGHCEKDA